MFNSDMFDTKKKLKGQREPVFPSGVPGTTTGVPADLVKGYQPPPDQADADADRRPCGRPAAQSASPRRSAKAKAKSAQAEAPVAIAPAAEAGFGLE